MEDCCTKYQMRLESADSFLINARKDLILDMVEGKKVLDIGCGTGFVTNKIAKTGREVVGIDIEQEGIRIARKNAGKKDKVKYLLGDFFDFKFKKGSFDSVILADVLEHVKEEGRMLHEILKVLKKNGVLILTVPAFQSLFGYHDREVGHLRRYSKKKLEKQVRRAGFTIEKIRYWNMISIPMVLLFSKFLNKRYPHSKSRMNRLLEAYFNIIEKNISMPIGVSLVIKARKR